MRLVASAVLVLLLGVGLPAAAFDLTGTWEGSWSCTEFEAGVKEKLSNKESTIVITSIGNGTFRARVDGASHFRGIEIGDVARPERGEIAIVACGSDDDLVTGHHEFGRFKVTTSGGRGSLSGITVWSRDASHVATCKYKFTRVDTVNPNLTYPCS